MRHSYADALRLVLEVGFVGLLPFAVAGAMRRSRGEVSLVGHELDQKKAHLLWVLLALLQSPFPPVRSCTPQHDHYLALAADYARREPVLPALL